MRWRHRCRFCMACVEVWFERHKRRHIDCHAHHLGSQEPLARGAARRMGQGSQPTSTEQWPKRGVQHMGKVHVGKQSVGAPPGVSNPVTPKALKVGNRNVLTRRCTLRSLALENHAELVGARSLGSASQRDRGRGRWVRSVCEWSSAAHVWYATCCNVIQQAVGVREHAKRSETR